MIFPARATGKPEKSLERAVGIEPTTACMEALSVNTPCLQISGREQNASSYHLENH